jgi:enoyl-CoA hydratase
LSVNTEREGPIAVVTMSRPEALNAFNTEQLRALLEAVSAVATDRDIRVAILTGEGQRAFAAGADIREMAGKSPSEALVFSRLGQSVARAIEQTTQPWIAAINGHALGGGCEMALACDIRIVSESATLGQPEVGLGVIPGFGGTQRLTRLVGPGIAGELILTGRRVSAGEALRLGLVNAVYPPDQLLPKAREMAQAIAAAGPLAVTVARRLIAHALDTDLASGLAREAENFALLFDSHDQKEGMRAFIEKRTAEFRGE